MALRKKLLYGLLDSYSGGISCCRYCSTPRVDLEKIRPMIAERIQKRANYYRVPAMVAVASEVLRSRTRLISGVSILLKYFNIWICRYCREVFVGDRGHLIRTCNFPKFYKTREHKWVRGGYSDLIAPVNSFSIRDVIQRGHRSDLPHVPAVPELCIMAGAAFTSESTHNSDYLRRDLTPHDLRNIANESIKAWEMYRAGVERLLWTYPARVCRYCSEALVGPSGFAAKPSGIFRHGSWDEGHFWKRARVDDLVPPQIVWHRRRCDPPVLVDAGRQFYGCAPGVVELCAQAGAVIPSTYFMKMKIQGRGFSSSF